MSKSKNMESSGSRDAFLTDMISQVQNEKIKNYINGRIVPQMKWYSNKSGECNRKFHRCMTASIFLGALIPVFSVFADGAIVVKVILALLGAAVTAINAYLSLYHYKDLWLDYRVTRERLLKILYCYFNDAGIFARKNTQEEKDVLLVNICEEELSCERNGWLNAVEEE